MIAAQIQFVIQYDKLGNSFKLSIIKALGH